MENINTKIVFEGLSKEKIILANEVLFKISEQKEAVVKTIKHFQDEMGKIENQIWFLENSKIKQHVAEMKKWQDFQKTMIEQSKKALPIYERHVEQQNEELQKLTDFLEKWNSHVKVELRQSAEDETLTEKVVIYDQEHIGFLVDFAICFGIVDFEETIKETKNESEKKH